MILALILRRILKVQDCGVPICMYMNLRGSGCCLSCLCPSAGVSVSVLVSVPAYWCQCQRTGVNVSLLVSVSSYWCQCQRTGASVSVLVLVWAYWCQCQLTGISISVLVSVSAHKCQCQLTGVSVSVLLQLMVSAVQHTISVAQWWHWCTVSGCSDALCYLGAEQRLPSSEAELSWLLNIVLKCFFIGAVLLISSCNSWGKWYLRMLTEPACGFTLHKNFSCCLLIKKYRVFPDVNGIMTTGQNNRTKNKK